jgi:hypothetical protein
VCDSESHICMCRAIQGLGLMDELAGPRLYVVVKKDMTARVEDIGTDQVDICHLEMLLSVSIFLS